MRCKPSHPDRSGPSNPQHTEGVHPAVWELCGRICAEYRADTRTFGNLPYSNQPSRHPDHVAKRRAIILRCLESQTTLGNRPSQCEVAYVLGVTRSMVASIVERAKWAARADGRTSNQDPCIPDDQPAHVASVRNLKPDDLNGDANQGLHKTADPRHELRKGG